MLLLDLCLFSPVSSHATNSRVLPRAYRSRIIVERVVPARLRRGSDVLGTVVRALRSQTALGPW